ncbi:hypothetical protein ACU5AY_14480 [Rhizobium sp. PAMB 3174]
MTSKVASNARADRQLVSQSSSQLQHIKRGASCLLVAASLLTGTGGAYACGFDNIPESFRPIDTSEGTTNSMGMPVIGGEAASTRAERECREARDRQSWYQTLGIATDDKTETLFEGIADSFTAGGSIVFNASQSYQRAYENPPELGFHPQEWLTNNSAYIRISEEYLPMIGAAASDREAHAVLANIQEREAAKARVQRMGTIAQLIAGVIPVAIDVMFLLGSLAVLSVPARGVWSWRNSRTKGRNVTA